MLMKIIKKFLEACDRYDELIEGRWADEYLDPAQRDRISREYQLRYRPLPTPITHPEQYDPLDPPRGYRYDPYYEIWSRYDQ
jgi:hypothetical protein